MDATVCDLVVFDYYQSCNERVGSKDVEREMRQRPSPFLVRSMCGLQDEDSLCECE